MRSWMDALAEPISREPGGAAFSADGHYRYALWRNWRGGRGQVPFVGLNPSTADARRDDPTVRRLIGFARDWGYAGMRVANLFAWRSTHPSTLKTVPEPIGSENRKWLRWLARVSNLTVVCWGNHGRYLDQDRAALKVLRDTHCFRINATGAPSHPLYLPGRLRPFRYRRYRRSASPYAPAADKASRMTIASSRPSSAR